MHWVPDDCRDQAMWVSTYRKEYQVIADHAADQETEGLWDLGKAKLQTFMASDLMIARPHLLELSQNPKHYQPKW